MFKLLLSGLALILLSAVTTSYLTKQLSASGSGLLGPNTMAANLGGGLADNIPHFVYSDDNTSIAEAEGFGFEKSSNKLIESNASKAYWESLAMSLVQNKQKRLHLQGLYLSSESNPTKSANLGIARAEVIKQKLVALGAPASAIAISGMKTSGAFFVGDTYIGGVNFLEETPIVKQVKSEVVKSSTPKEGLVYQPLNLYFAPNQKEIIITPEIKAYFDELKVYLAKNPTAKISVLGFTDNQGDSLKNVVLSTQRAETVKNYMMNKKFDGERLVLRGKGSLRPIGNNETATGRAQNRRVEVRIMYN